MYYILCVVLRWYVVYLSGIIYEVMLSYAGMVSIGLWYLLHILCCFFSSVGCACTFGGRCMARMRDRVAAHCVRWVSGFRARLHLFSGVALYQCAD
jgi:hypothetical protein